MCEFNLNKTAAELCWPVSLFCRRSLDSLAEACFFSLLEIPPLCPPAWAQRKVLLKARHTVFQLPQPSCIFRLWTLNSDSSILPLLSCAPCWPSPEPFACPAASLPKLRGDGKTWSRPIGVSTLCLLG